MPQTREIKGSVKSYEKIKETKRHIEERNQKSHNNILINLFYSISTRMYLVSGFFPHMSRSFVARSVRKSQANTSPYRPHARLISNQ